MCNLYIRFARCGCAHASPGLCSSLTFWFSSNCTRLQTIYYIKHPGYTPYTFMLTHFLPKNVRSSLLRVVSGVLSDPRVSSPLVLIAYKLALLDIMLFPPKNSSKYTRQKIRNTTNSDLINMFNNFGTKTKCTCCFCITHVFSML